MAHELSVEVEKFIARQIPSLEALEILLLLSEEPRHEWTVDELYRRVLSSAQSVKQRLEEFEQRGLVLRGTEPQPLFKLAPPSAESEATLKALAGAYKERRHKVIEAIYARPVSGVQAFADAFKLRKK